MASSADGMVLDNDDSREGDGLGEIKKLRRVLLNRRVDSTPSTRRLLDGVAVPVRHRSTEPVRPRLPSAPDTDRRARR